MLTKTRGPLPPVILLLFFLLQLGLHRWLPVQQLMKAPVSYLGVVLIVLGLAVIAAPARAFSRADTTIIPFRESSELVTSGVYRYTRNPMYVGMLAILLGVAVLCGSVTPFIAPVLFIPVLNVRVIQHEEQMLEERFGDVYRDYMQSVRRWL